MGKQIWRPGTMLYPLPVIMATCGNIEMGTANIITIAWTGIINSDPAMTYISIRPERHSHQLIKSSGEFVLNLTTEKLVFQTDFCGVRSGKDLNKFETMKLSPEKASIVKAPMIAESPVNLECVVKDIVPLGSHDMFMAEIVAVHADEAYMDQNGRFCLEKSNPICYSHGEYYGLGEKLGKFGFSVARKENLKR